MFYYLDGAVAEILPGLAVIDCGGVGYACLTTNHTLSQLRKGERGKLYTYLNVGESVFDLYGFASSKELESFRMLLGVSCVGPKAALAILSACTPEALALAVVSGDEKALTAAPGVGKKIAQRVIHRAGFLRWKCWQGIRLHIQGGGSRRRPGGTGILLPGGRHRIEGSGH